MTFLSAFDIPFFAYSADPTAEPHLRAEFAVETLRALRAAPLHTRLLARAYDAHAGYSHDAVGMESDWLLACAWLLPPLSEYYGLSPAGLCHQWLYLEAAHLGRSAEVVTTLQHLLGIGAAAAYAAHSLSLLESEPDSVPDRPRPEYVRPESRALARHWTVWQQMWTWRASVVPSAHNSGALRDDALISPNDARYYRATRLTVLQPPDLSAALRYATDPVTAMHSLAALH